MEIVAGLLLCAVLEGDCTQRTVWTQTILTEQRWNGNVTHNVNCPKFVEVDGIYSMLTAEW